MAASKATKQNALPGNKPSGKPQTADASTARQKPHPGKTKRAIRQRGKLIARAILEGKSDTQACKDAGYSDSYANSHKKEIMNNPEIKKSFTAIMDAAGLTDEHIAARIKELSTAKETKFFADKGKVVETRDVEALGTQADMIQFAARLKGHLVDKTEVKVDRLEDILKDLDGGRKVDK